MNQPDLSLEHDAFGRLIAIDRQGHRHVGVIPIRAFPYSSPLTWISLCDADGHEMECISDVAKLPPDVRTVLEANLAQREFVPVIRRITRISPGPVPTKWEVETDRGPTEFLLNS